MFTNPKRAGDGSDPFSRYQYCFNEFQRALQNLVDPESGTLRAEINLHAMNCCL